MRYAIHNNLCTYLNRLRPLVKLGKRIVFRFENMILFEKLFANFEGNVRIFLHIQNLLSPPTSNLNIM